MPRLRLYGGGKAGQPIFSLRGEPDPPPDQKYRAPTQPLEQRLEEIRPAIAGFTSAMPLASSPIVAGVANLHASDQIPMRPWRDDTGLDKVLSEGRVYAIIP